MSEKTIAGEPLSKIPIKTVRDYIERVFPCEPPCDSWGVCDNCTDAGLICVGMELTLKDDRYRGVVEAAKDMYLKYAEVNCDESDLLYKELRSIGAYDSEGGGE